MESKDVSSKISEEILQARLEELRAENALLMLKQEQLILENSEKDKLLIEAQAEKNRLLEETERLRHQLNQLLQDKFGTKSEKSKNLPEETFDEATEPDNAADIEAIEQEIFVIAHQRKRGKPGRKPLPAHLLRIKQIYDLETSEKICSCGCQLTKIGEEISEQLDIIPATIQVVQHVKYKYACHACEDTIKTALGPKLPIPKSIATPGVLAHVSVSKFKDHLPLYRQENIFRRMGVDIARNTLSLWMIKTAQILAGIYKLAQDIIISHDVAYSDETRVQVLKEPNRKAEDKAYMWCFIGGSAEKRCVIYHYNISRGHAVIEEMLEGFEGFLHCDGFSGYDAYASDHHVELVGCWMHCRRKFFEVARSTKSKGLAHTAVQIIKALYDIEAEMRDQGLSIQQRYDYRQQYSQPLLKQFKTFLDENRIKVLSKSPLGEAFTYAVNQWPKLIRYIEDGRLEIDNGLSERKIKPFVIGRKNWLFCNSIAGAKAAEVLFSIIETCELHKVEPYAYLRFVLTKIPYAKTVEELEQLMPFNVKSDQLMIASQSNNTS
jgi:transposase